MFIYTIIIFIKIIVIFSYSLTFSNNPNFKNNIKNSSNPDIIFNISMKVIFN